MFSVKFQLLIWTSLWSVYNCLVSVDGIARSGAIVLFYRTAGDSVQVPHHLHYQILA